jgi:anaerobic magnesium-protoporphyrin IX monomethyl ester cyclase
MKILLIEPFQTSGERFGTFKDSEGFFPHLGLISIRNYLANKGFEATYIDLQFGDYTKDAFIELLLYEKYDVVGVSAMTNNVLSAYSTFKLCKKVAPSAYTVLGGAHASILPERTLKECSYIDFLVAGEGEITLEELLVTLKRKSSSFKMIGGLFYRENGKVLDTFAREFIQELDILPVNFYKDIDLKRYIPPPHQYCVLPQASFVTQRGCPFKCTFCQVAPILGKKLRRHSPIRVIKELELMIEENGVRAVYFQDSTFTINRDYTISLLKEMIRRKLPLQWTTNTRVDCIDEELIRLMKEAGCWQLFFGLESGNEQSLRLLRKGNRITPKKIKNTIKAVKNSKIRTLGSFILGLPGEDEVMVQNTINFAKSLDLHAAVFFLPTPYPNSTLWKQCKSDGGLREDASWDDYLHIDFSNPVYVNPKIGKERMLELYDSAFREFYSSPKVILRNLISIHSFHDVRRYAKASYTLIKRSIEKKL